MIFRSAVLVVLLGGMALPQTLTFTSPTCGGAATGTISLSVRPVSGAVRVDYAMGSLDIGSSLSPLLWNTAWAMDGESEIEATAYNSGGGIVATGDYSQTNTCGASVAGGGVCTISVVFTPVSNSNPRTGTLTIKA